MREISNAVVHHMRYLSHHEWATCREITDAVPQYHPNTARNHMKWLCKEGVVEKLEAWPEPRFRLVIHPTPPAIELRKRIAEADAALAQREAREKTLIG